MNDKDIQAILKQVEEIEAWAGGLLDKCTKTKKLIQQAGAVSTASRNRQQVLTPQQLAEISAKGRKRRFGG